MHAELLAELEQAKRLNIACLLHVEHRSEPEPSVWTLPPTSRRGYLRARCRRELVA